MKKVELILNVYEYEKIDELQDTDRQLVEKAIEASQKAYAPYSQFHVGAAVLLENGLIITGNNQENAAYPSGLCAERVALFAANAQYPDVAVKAIAIVAFNNKNQMTPLPTPPCGACRQVMIETEMRFKKPIKVILAGKSKILIINSIKELLPLSFTSNELNL